MAVLRSCCFCFSTRTGAFILGVLGIISGAIALAPMAVFLDFHNYYVTQFVASERVGGNYIDDDQVPKMALFSKLLFSILLSLDVIYIFACILLLAGIASVKHMLILPWLIFIASGIIINITMVIAFMISIANYGAVAIFLGSSPCLALMIYLWSVVYSAYQMVMKQELSLRGSQMGPTATTSVSQSSLGSLRESIHRVIGGTPPPPYEAVTTKSPEINIGIHKKLVGPSPSSPPSPCHFKTSYSENAESPTRHSNDKHSVETPTSPTSPAIPTPNPLTLGSTSGNDGEPSTTVSHLSLPPTPNNQLTTSQSYSHICHNERHQKPAMRKSQSTSQATQVDPLSPQRMSATETPLQPPSPRACSLVRQEAVENDDNSVISDETSSMSSTSISIPDTNLVV